MAQAEGDSPSQELDGEQNSGSLVDTGDFDAAALQLDQNENADGAEAVNMAAEAKEEEAPPKKTGPGFIVRKLRWLIRWHPILFLGAAILLAIFAWAVYPEPESRVVPPAESFYYDGLDRLYRVLNPDLPLIAATPADEALAARNALLNLFIFHRDNLRDYPAFVNPYLLLAEADRILAEYNPAMAAKYWSDASDAYKDADAWESRDDSPERMAVYISNNFLGGQGGGNVDVQAVLDPGNDEVVLRRQRRNDYINYRIAEADVNLDRPELARPTLDDLRRREDSRRREELRQSSQEESVGSDVARHAFELGPDEYRHLDLLLARTYDGLGQLDRARSWYLRYLAAVPEGRNHPLVIERLANIAMSDGDVYRRVNPEQAAEQYQAAAEYFRQLATMPSVEKTRHDNAILGLAVTNSRLAELVPAQEIAGIDELSSLGRTARRWLEEFSGQQLPRRTLSIPEAVGETLAKPELTTFNPSSLPALVAGNLSAMAGGEVVTPHERRRRYLTAALENYDRVAEALRGTPAGDHAAVMAARESWNLGLKAETEARLERMLDALSSPDLILAARLGLAHVALDRGELRRAGMLVLGGYVHPLPVWFTDSDADWRMIALRLGTAANREQPGVWKRLWETIPEEGREIASYAASGRRLDDAYVSRFLRNLNSVLRRDDLYTPEDFPPRDRSFYLDRLLGTSKELLTAEDIAWQNRLLLEEALPYDIAQRGLKDNIGFEPFPRGNELTPGGLVTPEEVRGVLTELGSAWADAAARAQEQPEQLRMVLESNIAYQTALDNYPGDPGDVLYDLAQNYEALAVIRELQGRHLDALSDTATAARNYLDVSFRSQGSPREMESLLLAGDAFFRAGLLERTVESQRRFLDRFGHAVQPGGDQAMTAVRAENLLGRAYWFLGDAEQAIASFRRNIPRRTPDRFKSIYYIGRVLMDEGQALNNAALLGSDADPLPALDRNGDPQIETALQAFNFLRQSPGIDPTARAWRWATFDLAKLRYLFAEQARLAADESRPWLPLYEDARRSLTEALERYPLRRNGYNDGQGISIRIEPEDYADVMTARFETEYMLALTLLILAEAAQDESLFALSRAHLENVRNRDNYANALFNQNLDRFQLNAAIIREEVEGEPEVIDPNARTLLPRTRVGDDEGPSRSPERLEDMLKNSMQLLGNEYFRAGERARERQLLASADPTGAGAASDAAGAFYQDSYRVWQDFYDRFGLAYGPQAMVMMGDDLSRMGHRADAANHYRMARNMMELLQADLRSDGMLNIGPAFWGRIAEERLKDLNDGYQVP